MQEKARAVVMITRLKEKGRVKCEPYIPAYSAKYGEVQVTVKQVLEKNGYSIRQLHLKVTSSLIWEKMTPIKPHAKILQSTKNRYFLIFFVQMLSKLIINANGNNVTIH